MERWSLFRVNRSLLCCYYPVKRIGKYRQAIIRRRIKRRKPQNRGGGPSGLGRRARCLAVGMARVILGVGWGGEFLLLYLSIYTYGKGQRLFRASILNAGKFRKRRFFFSKRKKSPSFSLSSKLFHLNSRFVLPIEYSWLVGWWLLPILGILGMAVWHPTVGSPCLLSPMFFFFFFSGGECFAGLAFDCRPRVALAFSWILCLI